MTSEKFLLNKIPFLHQTIFTRHFGAETRIQNEGNREGADGAIGNTADGDI